MHYPLYCFFMHLLMLCGAVAAMMTKQPNTFALFFIAAALWYIASHLGIKRRS